MNYGNLAKITDSMYGVTFDGVKFEKASREHLYSGPTNSLFKFDRFESIEDSFRRYCNSQQLQALVDSRHVTRNMYESRKFRDDFEKTYRIIDEMRENGLNGDFYISTPDYMYRIIDGVTMNELSLDDRLLFEKK